VVAVIDGGGGDGVYAVAVVDYHSQMVTTTTGIE
jgi:hypothetical protein